jgi:hypothetical protein
METGLALTVERAGMAEGSGSINDGVTEGNDLSIFSFISKNISLMFNAWHGQETFLLTSIQTCSGAQPPAYSGHFQRFFPYRYTGQGMI